MELGAKSGSLDEVGKECQVIFTVLPNGSIVEDVLFGDQGVYNSIKEGSIVCDCSSVTPTESQKWAGKFESKGVDFVDSPVSGGETGAKGGITSSDIGTIALKVKKAKVLGQVESGIPVWELGKESKFPGMAYIIFPGNVGEVSTLREIVEELIIEAN